MATETVENYIKATYVLRRESPSGEAGVVRLAQEVGVTKGTATSMIKRLAKLDLADVHEEAERLNDVSEHGRPNSRNPSSPVAPSAVSAPAPEPTSNDDSHRESFADWHKRRLSLVHSANIYSMGDHRTTLDLRLWICMASYLVSVRYCRSAGSGGKNQIDWNEDTRRSVPRL